jgi:hypothetical protein
MAELLTHEPKTDTHVTAPTQFVEADGTTPPSSSIPSCFSRTRGCSSTQRGPGTDQAHTRHPKDEDGQLERRH